MNCANHPDAAVAAYCRECGKPLCDECRRAALGSVYCAEHLPANVPAAESLAAPPPVYTSSRVDGAAQSSVQDAAASPYTAPRYTPAQEHGPLPWLAFGLGFIPGVGAIYNGQYAKGLIHAIVFGLLVTIASNDHGPLEPLIGIGIAVWVFYMAFEAYHTARKRRYGVEVQELSSLLDTTRTNSRVPAGPLVLIGLGVLLLLDTTNIISLDQVERYWPAGLIVLGLYLLYVRVSTPHNPPSETQGAGR